MPGSECKQGRHIRIYNFSSALGIVQLPLQQLLEDMNSPENAWLLIRAKKLK